MATTNAGRRFARAGAPRRRAGGCSSPPRAPVACRASAFHADVTGQYHTYAPALFATSLPLPPPGHVARAWLCARMLPVPRSLLHRGRPCARARAAPAALLPRAAYVRSQRQQRGACARRLGLMPKCISHELHFDITTNPIYIYQTQNSAFALLGPGQAFPLGANRRHGARGGAPGCTRRARRGRAALRRGTSRSLGRRGKRGARRSGERVFALGGAAPRVP